MKWIMKQYWRVSQIRVLLSLGLSMLVLGKLYISFVPVLQDFGVFGALTLGAILFLFFMGLGWVYDARISMWSQKLQAEIERNPYRYVPAIKNKMIDFPFFFAFTTTLRAVLKRNNAATQTVDDFIDYLLLYMKRGPSKKDITKSYEQAEIFLSNHPFSEALIKKGDVSLVQRLKLGFEVQMLRLRWIQSLTGLVQDLLVFAATYGVLLAPVLFPDALAADYLFLGLASVSLPLMIILLAVGWYYDKKLKVWTADSAVKAERNPFTYVASPQMYGLTVPFLFSLLVTLKRIQERKGITTTEIEKGIHFLTDYLRFSTDVDLGMKQVKQLRNEFGVIFPVKMREAK